MPGPNIELLRKALRWAEAESEKPKEESAWYQGDWCVNVTDIDAEFYDEHDELYVKSETCGTAYCIAGYATIASLTGDQRLDVANQRVIDISNPDYEKDVEGFGQEVLGLSRTQANRLFDGDNDIHKVREAVREIVGYDL